ncbi:hypothetical protein BDW62DRAFT_214442 [Aspergillus aurantiobrunneus]
MASSTFRQYYLPEKEGFNSLVLREVPKTAPKFGQILVHIKAVSLNWRDGIIALGTYPFPGPDALVPGSDGAGIVEEVGEGVTEWKVGDRVLANFTQDHLAGRLDKQSLLSQLGGEIQGLLGEYFIFPKTGVVKIPDYLSFEEASCLPCAALTAWNALYGLVPIRPGQTVLLQGTGGVSTFGLQIAHVAGATTIVTSSSDEKLSKAKALGATHLINYRTNPDWAAEAKRLTGGHGVDHIIEVGGTLTLQQSFDAIALHGLIHCIGHITNPDPLGAGKELRAPDAAFLALDRVCIVRGVVVGSREQLQDMLDCFQGHSIRPVIDRVFDFEQTRQAYEYLWSSNHTGKLKRRKGTKHDRTGCLTCRYRHKKCVENTFPECGTCMRLNLECLREPKRQVAPAAQTRAAKTRTEPAVSPIPTARTLACFQDYHPRTTLGGGRYSMRQYAMKYYVNVMTQLLTVKARTEFVPMAVDSPALSGALVSWASGHLSSVDNRYRITALEARSTALSRLAESISYGSDDISVQETNAATCLVLLTSEVCLGNHAGWYDHLIGAKNIIMSAKFTTTTDDEALVGPDAFKGSVEGRWILRNFAYHDILGSVTLGTKPLLSPNYLHGITGVVDTYLGVASGILILIAEISCLDPGSKGDTRTLPDIKEIISEIEQRLNAWQCHSDTAPALVALGYAYRSAAMIYLYRRMRSFVRFSTEHPSPAHRSELLGLLAFKISLEAIATLRHVAEIPSTEIADSALLFPLFLAGGEATETREINFVRQRLQVMLEKRHFQNISRALSILEEVWNRRLRKPNASESEDADWQEILASQSCRLLLT